MSHWAEIDQNNVVIRVLVGSNEGDEGEAFMKSLDGTWIKTSYNATIRKHFAGIGYSYNEEIDAFVAPQCHSEATLDLETANWICGNEAHNVIS